MKKYTLATTAAVISLLLPLSFALAEDGNHMPPPPPRIHGGFQIHMMDGQGDDDNASTTDNENEHATSTPWMHGERKGIERGDASSTEQEHGNKMIGIHHGLPNFFRWIFSLPATTTVGDIRTAIEASTTASTTSGSQGLGFWAHFMSFFHFGRDN